MSAREAPADYSVPGSELAMAGGSSSPLSDPAAAHTPHLQGKPGSASSPAEGLRAKDPRHALPEAASSPLAATPADAGLRVAFQGELGAYSEEAVLRFFGEAATPVPHRQFRDVGRAVAEEAVDYGLLPIENTVAGSVVQSYDVLAAEDVRVIGEVIVPIHHCVLGVPGATLAGLARILSHPVALAQCGRFLEARPRVEAVAVYDTAGAAKEVAGLGNPTIAALAGRTAALRYGLVILAENVEDRPDNQTRFLVIAGPGRTARAGAVPSGGKPPDRGMKTALIVETENVPGALVRVLLPFAERNVNLSKLESRPADVPWTYRFFMELEADAGSPEARQAFEEVKTRATRLRVLGSYARWPRD
ncbi:MAG: prephenate dehydratase [Gemmatimonadetes bacterium]|nr:prephenate dehydratase [Gemmatimonadota bacterium]